MMHCTPWHGTHRRIRSCDSNQGLSMRPAGHPSGQGRPTPECFPGRTQSERCWPMVFMHESWKVLSLLGKRTAFIPLSKKALSYLSEVPRESANVGTTNSFAASAYAFCDNKKNAPSRLSGQCSKRCMLRLHHRRRL